MSKYKHLTVSGGPTPKLAPSAGVEKKVNQAALDKAKKVPSSSAIRWENGVPIPVRMETINKNYIPTLLEILVSEEYEGHLDETGERFIDSRYAGNSYLEAILRQMVEGAAAGNAKSAEMVLDRLMGKPKQAIESVNMNMSYEQFLDRLAEDVAKGPKLDPESVEFDISEAEYLDMMDL
jgi:hypothetical protein